MKEVNKRKEGRGEKDGESGRSIGRRGWGKRKEGRKRKRCQTEREKVKD